MATVPVTRRRPLASLRRDPSATWRHVDLVMVGCLAVISLLGVVMVYSASRGPEPPYDTRSLKRQLFYVVVGALVAVVVAAVDYRRILDRAPLLYGGTTFLLLAVSQVGRTRSGTQGWFQVGPFQLQPSEFAKLTLVLGFTYMAVQFHGDIDLRRLGVLLASGALPVALVMLQPDLGTALVSIAITFVLLVAAGVRGRHLALLGLGAALCVILVLTSDVLGEYQKNRLTTFVGQERPRSQEELRDTYWNLEQSKIAIGSGGLTGKGLFNGPQTRLGNVPEQHTDFIFTAVGEQLGLVGSATVVGLYGAVVWRIWRTAQLARDEAGTLICMGILALFVFQIFQNVGMTMGIMPITGIPLPFMSFGGSSTLMAFAAVGLVVNVHMRRFR